METFTAEGNFLRRDVPVTNTVRYDLDTLTSQRADLVAQIAEIDRILAAGAAVGLKPTPVVAEVIV